MSHYLYGVIQNFRNQIEDGIVKNIHVGCSCRGCITMCTSQNFGVGLSVLLPQCIRCSTWLFSIVPGAITRPVVSTATVNANCRALLWGPTHMGSMIVILTCCTKVVIWAVLPPVCILTTHCALDAQPTCSQIS